MVSVFWLHVYVHLYVQYVSKVFFQKWTYSTQKMQCPFNTRGSSIKYASAFNHTCEGFISTCKILTWAVGGASFLIMDMVKCLSLFLHSLSSIKQYTCTCTCTVQGSGSLQNEIVECKWCGCEKRGRIFLHLVNIHSGHGPINTPFN